MGQPLSGSRSSAVDVSPNCLSHHTDFFFLPVSSSRHANVFSSQSILLVSTLLLREQVLLGRTALYHQKGRMHVAPIKMAELSPVNCNGTCNVPSISAAVTFFRRTLLIALLLLFLSPTSFLPLGSGTLIFIPSSRHANFSLLSSGRDS